MNLGLLVLAAIAVGLVLALSGRRVVAARLEAQRIRAVFSRYVSPVVVDEILARHDHRIFSGRSGYATILVCRIWSFALFAERLNADETIRYLNEFYALAGKTIQKHRGMIDKFLGDGIIGAFGFPLEDAMQEEHAIRAALEIIRLVDGMNARWASESRRPLRVGIGVHSGMVIAGDVGFTQRREYTVVGLAAIVASRLQEHTESMRAYILVTDATLEPVREMFTAIACQAVPLRGMKQNVRAYSVRGPARTRDEEALNLPPASAFKRTTIEEGRLDVTVADVPEPAPAPKATRPAPRPTAPRTPKAPQKPFVHAPFQIPETRGFRAYDESPANPEIPATEGYYEDDSGRPPLKLPP